MSGPFGSSQWMYKSGGYEIDNSLRFDDGDSAFLSKSLGTPTNNKIWTFSCWIKRGNLGGSAYILNAHESGSIRSSVAFTSADKLVFVNIVDGQSNNVLLGTSVLRDPSAWYHIVAVYDSTEGTNTNRIKIFINNSQDTLTAIESSQFPDGDDITTINKAQSHNIGYEFHDSNPGGYYDGYIAETHFIDGTALTPSSFAETGDYGEWKPIKYAGSYGDNGFYLDFKSSGVGTAGTATIGADRSGNTNHFTSTNIAATDQMIDTPTNNFCNMNILSIMNNGAVTYSEGNLKLGLADNAMARGSIMPSSGKWYWEANLISTDGANGASIGICKTGYISGAAFDQNALVDGYVYVNNGTTRDHATSGDQSYAGASYAADDIMAVAYDADNGTLAFLKNNAAQGTAYSSLSGQHGAYFTGYGNTANWVVNFGQDSSFAGTETAQGNTDGNGVGDFYYAPPSGFLALCTKNLPEPDVVPGEHFNSVLYTGNGTAIGSGGQAVTGLGFQPGLLIGKARSDGNSTAVYDQVRGVEKELNMEGTAAEDDRDEGVTAFGADGFTVGSHDKFNRSGTSMVAWSWKANGSGSNNTDGDITSTVSVNLDAGFSIVKYTATGTTGNTFGHGLGAVPDTIWFKSLTTQSWNCFFPNTFMGGTKVMQVDNQSAATDATHMNNTMPTSTVITLGANQAATNAFADGVGQAYIVYCWKNIEGFSKIGEYEGSNNADSGTFVNCGFRPAYLMIKNADAADTDWSVLTSKINTNNPVSTPSFLDASVAEQGAGSTASNSIDFTSNGFNQRNADIRFNDPQTYVFMAFAETPFKYANAR